MKAHLERQAALAAWLKTLYYGATREMIRDHFADVYDQAPRTAKRMILRDLRALQVSRKLVRVRTDHETVLYVAPEHTHRILDYERYVPHAQED